MTGEIVFTLTTNNIFDVLLKLLVAYFAWNLSRARCYEIPHFLHICTLAKAKILEDYELRQIVQMTSIS